MSVTVDESRGQGRQVTEESRRDSLTLMATALKWCWQKERLAEVTGDPGQVGKGFDRSWRNKAQV